MITFELEESEEDKKFNEKGKKLYGKEWKKRASQVIVRGGEWGNPVGKIFSPSSSSHDNINSIQVCGFSEAFDLWGCGIFHGYKDIQLLFDDGVMGGKDHNCDLRECCRCYRRPCQCEVLESEKNPFKVKREFELKKRIIKK